jgi:hypothetical protein
MNSVRLHRQIVQQMLDLGLRATAPQRENLAWLCQSLAYSPDCHLATLALHIPLPGQRESLIQRERRYLKNAHVQVARCYAPWLRNLLTHWPSCECCLVMDRTDIEHDASILLLGAAYRKRLLPLVWQVLPFGASGEEAQVALLRYIQPFLPPVRTCFYADSEFRSVKVQDVCRQFDWHWQVGLKSDLYFGADDTWQPLCALGLRLGERRYVQGVFINKGQPFGPVNLIADWAATQQTPRYWALDLPADAQAWRRGRKRYWIEPCNRDYKSYGFDLEQSKITEHDRLNVLLLAMAITTLWLIHVGDWLIRSGRSRELMPAGAPDYSVFRLGRDYLQRARTLEQRVPIGFSVVAAS